MSQKRFRCGAPKPPAVLALPLPKIKEKNGIYSLFYRFAKLYACWGEDEEGDGYQDALDGEILQPTVTGRVEDDRKGLVGGLYVAEFDLVLEGGWRGWREPPLGAAAAPPGPGLILHPPGSSGPGGSPAAGRR